MLRKELFPIPEAEQQWAEMPRVRPGVVCPAGDAGLHTLILCLQPC